MSAPSTLHEDRVRTLETVAALAGIVVPASIGPECVPDVARVSIDGTVVLVADAKATETPGCTATIGRLRRYVRAVRPLVEAGVIVRVAVCHGDRGRVDDWQRNLTQLVAFAGLAVARGSATHGFDADTFVTSVDLRKAER